MTRKLVQKIHRKPRGAPVVLCAVNAPAAAAALGRELADQEPGAVVYFAGLPRAAGQGQVPPEGVELSVHGTSLA
jgi:hypothetical protein